MDTRRIGSREVSVVGLRFSADQLREAEEEYRRGKGGSPRGAAWTIAGATSPEQARSNAAAARWDLTDTELTEVDSFATRPA